MSAPAERLAEVIEAGRAPALHTAVAIRRGDVILEHYGVGEDHSWGEALGVVTFGPDTLHDLRSITKSVVGLLYGIALAEGLVPEPEEPLLPHFPAYADLARDPQRARLTVEHALTMTLGLDWNENLPYDTIENSEIAMEHAPDRYRYVLERPIAEEPGRTWRYCGGATTLLGRLIVQGAGMPLEDVARERLFEPLGIERTAWLRGGDGEAGAASGLRLTPLDLARIGQTVLAGGVWQGRQVVPADWLRRALEPRIAVEDKVSYGYQWYRSSVRGRDGTRHPWSGGMGNGGQLLAVVPELDLVVAIAAGAYDAEDQWSSTTRVFEDVVVRGIEP